MYLKPGDLVAIVSPARAISEAEIVASVRYLESHGFRVRLAPHLFERYHQFAGTDEQKITDIQACIDDPEVKAIWSARGGYGSVRIIDHLDLRPLKQHFKWLVGYSDFTVFHSHLNKQLHIPSIHATMPVNVTDQPDLDEEMSNSSLWSALTGQHLAYGLDQHQLNRTGNAKGQLVGGNLSILYSLCGSPSDLQTAGKILFIEDLDEYLYHIDRMMMNLKRTGKLDQLSALVIGGMSDMNDNTIPYGKSAEEIILEHVVDFQFPVYFGFQAGHVKPNLALRLGMDAEIRDNRLILSA